VQFGRNEVNQNQRRNEKMIVKFKDVGRNKKSWEAHCDGELTYKFMYGQVKSNAAIMSSDLEFGDNGTIFAGFRSVGTFEVLPKAIGTNESA
jgi:hypothetical protein